VGRDCRCGRGCQRKGVLTVQVEIVPIESLHENPANTRSHNRRNLDAIKDSLSAFAAVGHDGQVDPLIVQASTGMVIGGNGRLAAMRELGWKTVAVVKLDLSDIRAAALGIALNRTQDLSSDDPDTLAKVLAQIQTADDELLAATGFDPGELDRMIGSMAGEEDPSVTPDEYEPQGQLPHLKIGDRSIAVSEGEMADFAELLERYIQDNGNPYGFIRWVVDHVRP